MRRAIIFGVAVCVAIGQFPAVATASEGEDRQVILTHVLAGMPSVATEEVVVLRNMSESEVELTGWCLRNKKQQDVACFSEDYTRYRLPAQQSALIVSADYYAHYSDLFFDVPLIYEPSSQSSGSIVGSSDSLEIVDSEGTTIDAYAWSTSWPSGTYSYRDAEDSYEAWRQAVIEALPSSGLERYEDETPPAPVPCQPLELICDDSLLPLQLTEILPNSKGSDEGNEYIELHNPNSVGVALAGYTIVTGMTSQKTISLPESIVIPALSYVAIYNHEVAYTLVNTTGQVALYSPEGLLASITESYTNPKDDEAWALIDDVWQYTNRPTPGYPNLARMTEHVVAETAAATLKPCADNQYRHPETNRCRLIATSTPAPTPCKDGYYRHPETNRCRKIEVASEPAPCKEDQERNPETGRCRKVQRMTVVDGGVLGVKTEESVQQWYIVLIVMTAAVGLLLYGAWEWRHELHQLWLRMKTFLKKRQ